MLAGQAIGVMSALTGALRADTSGTCQSLFPTNPGVSRGNRLKREVTGEASLSRGGSDASCGLADTALIGHPESGDYEAEDSGDPQREDRCEAAVELGDFCTRVVTQEDGVGHAGQ